MVDVKQHGIDVKPVDGQVEKVAMNKLAAMVLSQRPTKRDEMASMPADHRGQRINYAQRSNSRVIERGSCREAET